MTQPSQKALLARGTSKVRAICPVRVFRVGSALSRPGPLYPRCDQEADIPGQQLRAKGRHSRPTMLDESPAGRLFSGYVESPKAIT
jgi:hypothetical protein